MRLKRVGPFLILTATTSISVSAGYSKKRQLEISFDHLPNNFCVRQLEGELIALTALVFKVISSVIRSDGFGQFYSRFGHLL